MSVTTGRIISLLRSGRTRQEIAAVLNLAPEQVAEHLEDPSLPEPQPAQNPALVALEERLAAIEAAPANSVPTEEIEELLTRVAAVEAEVDAVEPRVGAVEADVEAVEPRVEAVEAIVPRVEAVEAVVPKKFTFGTPGDENGLFYWLGRNKGVAAFQNPVLRGLVAASQKSSYDANGVAQVALNRDPSSLVHSAEDATVDQWARYDLVQHRIRPTIYTIRGRTGSANQLLRNWVLEGSNNGTNWTTLDTRTNDAQQVNATPGTWGTYAVTDAGTYFRYLRIRLTGVTSSGGRFLSFSEFELYGLVEAL